MWLNQNLILTPGSLNITTQEVRIPIDLTEDKSTLSLKLKGFPGSFVKVSIYGEGSNQPPILNLTWSSDQPLEDEVVLFDAMASTDPDGSVSEVHFDWGDNTSSTGFVAEHSWQVAGVYVVTVTVTDNDGAQISVPIEFTVLPKPKPPSDGGGLFYVTKSDGLPVRVHLSTSFPIVDEDSEIVSYTWAFGTGKTLTLYPHETDSYATIEHFYLEAGDYSVSLTITDSQGLTTKTSRTISLEDNHLPVPHFSVSQVAEGSGVRVTFDGSQSYDPNGDEIRFRWRFGDNTPEVIGTDQGVVSHLYAQPGEYLVRLRLRDSKLGRSEVFARIQVGGADNLAPIAVLTPSPLLGPAPHGVTFDASQSFDLDGSISHVEWNFGDHLSVINEAMGLTAHHTYKSPGAYYGSVTVIDNEGKSSTQYFEVFVPFEEGSVPPVLLSIYDFGKNSVEFDGSNTKLPILGQLQNFFWYFGDSTFERGRFQWHTYPGSGEYEVVLHAFDVLGNRFYAKSTIQVSGEGSESLIATFEQNGTSMNLGEAVQFDSQSSVVPLAGPIEAIWDFNDGRVLRGNWENLKQVSHTYQANGSYKPTLTLTTALGQTAIAYGMVHVVSGVQPVAVIEASARIGRVPFVVTLDSSKSYDPDGEISRTLWHFPSGGFSQSAITTYTISDPGKYFVELLVEDNQGNMNSQWMEFVAFSEEVPPGNLPPVAQISPVGGFIDAPGAYYLDALGSHDPDGEIVLYEWRWKGQVLQGSGPYINLSQEFPYLDDLVLIVYDNYGASSTASQRILFLQRPDPPNSDFMVKGPWGSELGLASEQDGAHELGDLTTRLIFEALLDPGQGSFEWKVNDVPVGTTRELNYLFSRPGTHTVSLVATHNGQPLPTQAYQVEVPVEACVNDLEGNMCLLAFEAPQNKLPKSAQMLTVFEGTGQLQFNQSLQDLRVELLYDESLDQDPVDLTAQMLVTPIGQIQLQAQTIRDLVTSTQKPFRIYVGADLGEGVVGHGFTAPITLASSITFTSGATDLSFTLAHENLSRTTHTIGSSQSVVIEDLEPGKYLVVGESSYGYIHGGFEVSPDSSIEVKLLPSSPDNLYWSVQVQSQGLMMMSAQRGYWDPPPLPPLGLDPEVFSPYATPFWSTSPHQPVRLTKNSPRSIHCTAVDRAWNLEERQQIARAKQLSQKISLKVYELGVKEYEAYTLAQAIYAECLTYSPDTSQYAHCMNAYNEATRTQSAYAQRVAEETAKAANLAEGLGYPVDPYMGDTSNQPPVEIPKGNPIAKVSVMAFIDFSRMEGGVLKRVSGEKLVIELNPGNLRAVDLAYPTFKAFSIPETIFQKVEDYDEVTIRSIDFRTAGGSNQQLYAGCVYDSVPEPYIQGVTAGKVNRDYAMGILTIPQSHFLPLSVDGSSSGGHHNPYNDYKPKREWAVSFKVAPSIGFYWINLTGAKILTKYGAVLSEDITVEQNLYSTYTYYNKPELKLKIGNIEQALGPDALRAATFDSLDLVFELTGKKVNQRGEEVGDFKTTRTIQVTPLYDGKKVGAPMYGGRISMYARAELIRTLDVLNQSFNVNQVAALQLPVNLTKYPCVSLDVDCGSTMNLQVNDASLPFGGEFVVPKIKNPTKLQRLHSSHRDGQKMDLRFFGDLEFYEGTCYGSVPSGPIYLDPEVSIEIPPEATDDFERTCERIEYRGPIVDGVQKVLDVADYLRWRKVCVAQGETSAGCVDSKPTRQMTRFAKWVLINRKAFDWLTKNTAGFDYLMSSGQGATWNFPGIESVMTSPSQLQRDR
ncbi:MAG: PKD domain-containing protein, partial [Bdellovibrionaceae bacterium]|nr:PKD domain-containing protein [Pseudobdellovibrionaceae bacterium]